MGFSSPPLSFESYFSNENPSSKTYSIWIMPRTSIWDEWVYYRLSGLSERRQVIVFYTV